MMAVALVLCLLSLLIGWYQHSYVPFYSTDRREVEDFLVYYRGAKAFWASPNVYESLINTGTAGDLPYSYPPSSLLFFLAADAVRGDGGPGGVFAGVAGSPVVGDHAYAAQVPH